VAAAVVAQVVAALQKRATSRVATLRALADRGSVAPKEVGVHRPPQRLEDLKTSSHIAYTQRRHDDPFYAAVAEAFNQLLFFEDKHNAGFKERLVASAGQNEAQKAVIISSFESATKEAAIKGLVFAVCMGSSAPSYSGPMDEATGRVSMRLAHPRMVAELEEAAAATPPPPPAAAAAAATTTAKVTSKAAVAVATTPPHFLGSDALCCLASLAIRDPSIGDCVSLMNKALDAKHRPYLAHVACAVFGRSCYLAMAGRLEEPLSDCLEAIKIAKKQEEEDGVGGVGDQGLAWSFKVSTAKCLRVNSRPVEAMELFQEAVDAATQALAERENRSLQGGHVFFSFSETLCFFVLF